MNVASTPVAGMEQRMEKPSETAPFDVSPAVAPTFDEFYAHHWESVVTALAVTLSDGELAADAMNEAMTRAFQRWSKISAYDNPAAWVYRVGLNWALSWKRRRRRERDRPVALAANPSAPRLRDDSFDAAMAALSVKLRAVVVCRIYLDWSVAHTAEVLDIAPGTVKSRLARALEQLKITMIDEGEEAT